ncbi:hypothetical protein A6E92_05085 [Streptomyces sp. S8]|nr:hypothetical protein A6E92_05085 [Streptomyces sp. S8]
MGVLPGSRVERPPGSRTGGARGATGPSPCRSYPVTSAPARLPAPTAGHPATLPPDTPVRNASAMP